jgi:hypothetical protein
MGTLEMKSSISQIEKIQPKAILADWDKWKTEFQELKTKSI